MDSATILQPSAPALTSSLIDSTGATDDESSGLAGINPVAWLKNRRAEAEIVRYLDDLFERAKTQRWKFESQWYVNLSYYFGRQWISWLNGAAPDIARLYEPRAPKWRVRLVVNRIKPAIRREMSKVMKEKPTGFVIPSSTDDSAIAAAKAGEAIFEHLWRELEMSSELWVAQFWRCCTGTGFVKDWWDPHAEDGDMVGNVGVEVPTPFHLFFTNLEQTRVDRQEAVIHLSMKSPQEVETVYGVKVAPDSLDRGGGVIESQYLQALNLEPGKATQVAVKEAWIKPNVRFPKGAMFVWAAGKLLYAARDEITGDPRWPLYKKEYPFTKFDGVPTGRFYGDSSIIDLLPLQKELNRTRSQIVEAKNQMAKPQLLAPKGSIEVNKITSEPGLVIQYTPGYEKPTQLKLEPLPQYVLAEVDRILQDIADISGQHEVSSGTVPSGVTAASALSFLQEQDDTMLAPIIHSLERGVERLGRHFLCHVHQYWDEAHTVKVLGPDNTWEIKRYLKADLRDNTDFHIQAGSAMPRSIAAKQAFIMELMKMGVIPPERGLRYLEMAETGQMYEEMQVDRRQAERENMRMSDPSVIQPQFDGLFERILAEQEMQASPMMDPMAAPIDPSMGGMPPEAMEAAPMPPMPPPEGGQAAVPPDLLGMGSPPPAPTEGTPAGHLLPAPGMSQTPPPAVPVNSWDDHEVHIEVHNNYRKRQEFENLDPRLKEEFERHVEMHRAALGLPPTVDPMQMRQMADLQAAMGGGAPQGDPMALPPGPNESMPPPPSDSGAL